MAGAHRHQRLVTIEIAPIAAHELLVSLVVCPANSARVMVLNKDAGCFGWPGAALAFQHLARFDHDLPRAPAIPIGARVERIVQDIADEAVSGKFPDQLKASSQRFVDRQFDVFLMKPPIGLADTSQVSKFLEHQFDRFWYP